MKYQRLYAVLALFDAIRSGQAREPGRAEAAGAFLSMKRLHPNVAKLELVAHALGPLREQLVFVGGCAVDLLLTDPAAAPARVTYDVDLLARVEALAGYHALEKQFALPGFKRDMAQDAPICRWRYNDLEVDLMPMDPGVLGFANRWYGASARLMISKVNA